MATTVEEMQTEIEARQAEIDTLANTPEITPEDDERLSTLLTEQTTAQTARDALSARNAKIVEARNATSSFVPGVAPTFIRKDETPTPDDARTMTAGQMTDAIAKSIEARDLDPGHARKILKRHATFDRAWAANLFARSTDVYQSAWVKLMTGRNWDLTPEERTAMSIGSNTNGGFLLPTHLDPTIILTNDGSSNAIRAISRVVTLTDGSSWNGITSAGVTASWDPELTEVSDDSPADFARPNIPVYQAKAFARASFEAFEDINGLASDVLMMFADARDRLEGAAHATGSGSAQPTGIFTALDANTNSELTSTTAATIGLVDLQAVKRGVGIRWRGRGTWVMNPVYGDAIKQLGTALSASYSTDITQSNTDLLLGRPLVETDDAPSAQTTTVRDNEIVFGDFNDFVIVDKPGGMSVEFVPNLFSTTTNLPDGSRGWLAHWRTGSDAVNDNAFVLLQDKTSA